MKPRCLFSWSVAAEAIPLNRVKSRTTPRQERMATSARRVSSLRVFKIMTPYRLRENLADAVSFYDVKYYHTQTLPDEKARRARSCEQDQTARRASFAFHFANTPGTNWRNAI